MSKSKKYDEIDDIRDDLQSLKSNVVELKKHIQGDASSELKDFKDTALERIDTLKESGREQLENLEARTRKKPIETVAYAFAAGLAASWLLGRR